MNKRMKDGDRLAAQIGLEHRQDAARLAANVQLYHRRVPEALRVRVAELIAGGLTPAEVARVTDQPLPLVQLILRGEGAK